MNGIGSTRHYLFSLCWCNFIIFPYINKVDPFILKKIKNKKRFHNNFPLLYIYIYYESLYSISIPYQLKVGLTNWITLRKVFLLNKLHIPFQKKKKKKNKKPSYRVTIDIIKILRGWLLVLLFMIFYTVEESLCHFHGNGASNLAMICIKLVKPTPMSLNTPQ